MKQAAKPLRKAPGRRSFLRKGLVIGGGSFAAGMLSTALPAFAKGNAPTKGDIAILRFLAALEIIESDLWEQYNELGGIQDKEMPGGSGNAAYIKALQNLDMDMPQYIHDNTEDEFSHAAFLNAYLKEKGAQPASLEQFRTLPGSQAMGAQKHKMRLTNLMELTVDTSWWTRYRSHMQNPDFGDMFPQAVPDLAKGKYPAIPRNDHDLAPDKHLQAIANTAGFHFGSIEQGGTSLYPSLAQRVTSTEVLRILLSIGPTEAQHFQTWQDKAGNAPALTDPTNGLMFPDLNATGSQDLQTNLIMPEPTVFLSHSLPICSIIRPSETQEAAMRAVKSLVAEGLFRGQSKKFFAYLYDLAQQADSAQRNGSY